MVQENCFTIFSESRMIKSTGDVQTLTEFVFYIIFHEYYSLDGLKKYILPDNKTILFITHLTSKFQILSHFLASGLFVIFKLHYKKVPLLFGSVCEWNINNIEYSFQYGKLYITIHKTISFKWKDLGVII